MKTVFFILGMILMFGIYYTLTKYIEGSKPDPLIIDLPEEWDEAKVGDTLRIYKIKHDTIFVGFYNTKNK